MVGLGLTELDWSSGFAIYDLRASWFAAIPFGDNDLGERHTAALKVHWFDLA